jgi:excinuclease UvrABC nuclease subunit
MTQASEEMRCEMAAKYRDLRKTVIKPSEQQKMATSPERDVDIFGYYREGKRLALQLFTLREGNIRPTRILLGGSARRRFRSSIVFERSAGHTMRQIMRRRKSMSL